MSNEPDDREWSRRDRNIWWLKYGATLGSVVSGLVIAGGVVWKTFQWFDSRVSSAEVSSQIQATEKRFGEKLQSTDDNVENIRQNLFKIMSQIEIKPILPKPQKKTNNGE